MLNRAAIRREQSKIRLNCRLALATIAILGQVPRLFGAARGVLDLPRALKDQGIENIVVDSASIEVNRRQRRTKTDKVDVKGLLMNYVARVICPICLPRRRALRFCS
ncbi:MAG: hypothetical protein ACRESZ_03375 [Methylococcales bacterium]